MFDRYLVCHLFRLHADTFSDVVIHVARGTCPDHWSLSSVSCQPVTDHLGKSHHSLHHTSSSLILTTLQYSGLGWNSFIISSSDFIVEVDRTLNHLISALLVAAIWRMREVLDVTNPISLSVSWYSCGAMKWLCREIWSCYHLLKLSQGRCCSQRLLLMMIDMGQLNQSEQYHVS